MGKKIFISYKYADCDVLSQDIDGRSCNSVRHYVDALQDKLGQDHVNKGEKDNEDLSNLEESTIESRIKGKIWDSSVTLVIISPSMREQGKPESEQWIPWEISYSLRLVPRDNHTSQRNALIAVVLPDRQGSYNYAIEKKQCLTGCHCNLWKLYNFFPIISSNMFNLKEKEENRIKRISCCKVYNGEVSYISLVRWDAFYKNPDKYIEEALDRQRNADDYNLTVNLKRS